MSDNNRSCAFMVIYGYKWVNVLRCNSEDASQLRKARHTHTYTQMENGEVLCVWEVDDLIGASVKYAPIEYIAKTR